MKKFKDLTEQEQIKAIENAKKEVRYLIKAEGFVYENLTEEELLDYAKDLAASAWYGASEVVQDCIG